MAADAVAQLLIAARRTAQQACTQARIEQDTRGVAEAELADAALADAIDARVLHPIVPDFSEFLR